MDYDDIPPSSIRTILTTATHMRDSLVPSKVDKGIIRLFYLRNLEDIARIKQCRSSYTAFMQMKTLCMHITLRDVCDEQNVSRENCKVNRQIKKQ